MQERFRDHWRRMVNHKPDPVRDLGDFGFYDPVGIWDIGPAYYQSNYNPGHLPKPGGMLAQTEAVRHDVRMYLKGIAAMQTEKEDQDEADRIAKYLGGLNA